jgi:hypothetical protein
MRKRSAGAVLAALIGFVAAGCGGSADLVTGKVTYNGQPVAGEVVFVGRDKKQAACPIADDGTYKIKAPPKGEVVVLVKGTPKAPSGLVTPKGGLKDAPPPPKGVEPPGKYSAEPGGLKFQVTGGEQTYDIELK